MKGSLCKKPGITRGLIIGQVLFVMSFILGISCYAPASTPTSASTATPEAAGTELEVTAKFAAFGPSTITVIKGETVKLTLTSTDASHTFTIDELGINIAVGAGQTVTKEFTVEKTGTFAFYCAVGQHRAAGMEGTLKVTE